jgi:hypothetical protein
MAITGWREFRPLSGATADGHWELCRSRICAAHPDHAPPRVPEPVPLAADEILRPRHLRRQLQTLPPPRQQILRPPAVSVAIAPGRRRAAKAGKGREMPAGNYRPRKPAAAGTLDAALAAVAWAIEGRGLGQPALDQVRSANQAPSNQPVGGARTRPTTTRVNVIASSSRRCYRVVGRRASPGTPGTA